MGLKFRHIAVEDAAAALEFLRTVGSETDNLTFGSEGLSLTPRQEEQYIESNANGPSSITYVALEDGRIVGMASAVTSNKERLKHRCEVSVSVLKESWGRHIGRSLMETVISEAKEKFGSELVYLEVRGDNERAKALYRQMGFTKSGEYPGFFKVNGCLIDFDFMYLPLK